MGKIIGIIIAIFALLGGVFWYFNRPEPPVESKFVQNIRQDTSVPNNEGTGIEVKSPGKEALVDNPYHVYQTFNNCGPATLTMILNWYGVKVTQSELGDQMRPYQIPSGDNDDKTIFTYEFTQWAQKYGLSALGRRNGDIETLKRFTANGIPVVVKTWLHLNEDIGHFRIVRGFNEEAQVIIQDDSYEGPNRRISYFDFLSMWQPFSYYYIIVYKPEQEGLVMAILGEESDEQVAWANALSRAEKERSVDPDNIYPIFNISTAAYHLGDYQKTLEAFESVEGRLPRRMLWYQIEPILAYQKLENYPRVFEISDRLLNGGNRAFSELYLIRGQIYLSQGERDKAREQFELAIQYNKNYDEARDAINNL